MQNPRQKLVKNYGISKTALASQKNKQNMERLKKKINERIDNHRTVEQQKTEIEKLKTELSSNDNNLTSEERIELLEYLENYLYEEQKYIGLIIDYILICIYKHFIIIQYLGFNVCVVTIILTSE